MMQCDSRGTSVAHHNTTMWWCATAVPPSSVRHNTLQRRKSSQCLTDNLKCSQQQWKRELEKKTRKRKRVRQKNGSLSEGLSWGGEPANVVEK